MVLCIIIAGLLCTIWALAIESGKLRNEITELQETVENDQVWLDILEGETEYWYNN